MAKSKGRNRSIVFRVSEEEYALLHKASARFGDQRGLSYFARTVLLAYAQYPMEHSLRQRLCALDKRVAVLNDGLKRVLDRKDHTFRGSPYCAVCCLSLTPEELRLFGNRCADCHNREVAAEREYAACAP